MEILKQVRYSALALLLLLGVSSCEKESNDPAPAPVAVVNTANLHVNEWVLDNMDFWYLWSEELPSSPNKSKVPGEFFKSLLSPEDRFSWIQDNYADLLNSLQGVSRETGYEYVLYKENTSNSVMAQILYVKPASPAEKSGLKRGDAITHINGQQLSTTNYQSILGGLANTDYTITYKPLLISKHVFDSERTAALSPIVYSEDPNYLSKVIEVNNRKIGYYVYNFFSTGTNQSIGKYDKEMDEIFAGFKATGITDLVLDLRFNSGGSEESATNLASLLTPDANDTKIFFKKEFNEKVEKKLLEDPNARQTALQRSLVSKPQNIGNQLAGRVYILTGSRTASASELIISGLKPYMDVVLIGNVTYGKNVGSISLYDENDPKNSWGMQPIVLKVFNSLDQSDYSHGFAPNILSKDDNLFIYPLGDIREELLSKAIEQITGTGVSGRKSQSADTREVVGHSLDDKKRSFTLNVEAF